MKCATQHKLKEETKLVPQLSTNILKNLSYKESVSDLSSPPKAEDRGLYPLNTFFKPMPLVLATDIGSRNMANALKVAFTTLCGFAEPNDLANTL